MAKNVTKSTFEALDAIVDHADDIPTALRALAAWCSNKGYNPPEVSEVLRPDSGFNGVLCYGDNPAHVPAADLRWDRYAAGCERLADILDR